VKKDKEEEFIELFGDHRAKVKDFLIYEGIGTKENVIVHGLN
jgi:translation initiation factor 1 (eIF-1/SUI1)